MTDGIIQQVIRKEIENQIALSKKKGLVDYHIEELYCKEVLGKIQQELIEKIKQEFRNEKYDEYFTIKQHYLKQLIGDNKE